MGSGSFGNVYKCKRTARAGSEVERKFLMALSAATYLGIDVAIKEVLPSNEYDVRKYFEREWRLMK